MKGHVVLMATVLMLAGVLTMSAQVGTVSLTLQECIRLAQGNGPLGVIARSGFESKVSTYRSFAATQYPQLSLQGDVPGYYRSINPVVLPDGSTVFTPQSEASFFIGPQPHAKNTVHRWPTLAVVEYEPH